MGNYAVNSRADLELSEPLRLALGGAFLLLLVRSVLAAAFAAQSFWQPSWAVASVLMGPHVLEWPAVFDGAAIMAAIVALYPTCLVAVLLLACAVVPLDLRGAIAAGAALGLGCYFMDLYAFLHWFPWLEQERTWMTLVSYLAFGAMAAWRVKRAEEPVRWPVPAAEVAAIRSPGHRLKATVKL
jgi:hypothetical protein